MSGTFAKHQQGVQGHESRCRVQPQPNSPPPLPSPPWRCASGVQQLLQQCCQHPTCQAVQPPPSLETLTHVFVECSVARRAWQWWQVMDPAAGLMPFDPRLLVLGKGALAPGQQCALLWDHLRVLVLQSLWVARFSAAGCPSHTAPALVGRFVDAVKHQVAMEWQRISSDLQWGDRSAL
jgi:hypothetical protein